MPKLSAKNLLQRDWERYDIHGRYNPTYFDKRAPSPLESPLPEEQPSPVNELHSSKLPPPREYYPDHYDDNDGFVALLPDITQPAPKTNTPDVIDLTPSPRARRAAARAKAALPKYYAGSHDDSHGVRVLREASRTHEDTPKPLVVHARVERTPPSFKPRQPRAVPSRSTAPAKREAHLSQCAQTKHVDAHNPRVAKAESKPIPYVNANRTVSTAHACLPPSARRTKPSQRAAKTVKASPPARDKKRTWSQTEGDVKCTPANKRIKVAHSKPQAVAVMEDQHPSDLRTFMNSIRASAWLHNAELPQSARKKPNRRRRTSRRLAEQRSQLKTPQAPPLKITPVDIATEATLRAWLRVVLSEALAAYWALSHPGARTYCSAIENGHIRHALRVVATFMGAEWGVISRVRSEDGKTVCTDAQFELYKYENELISVSEESVLEKVYEVVETVWTRFTHGKNKRRVSAGSRNSSKREKNGSWESGELRVKASRSQSQLSAEKARRADASSGQSRGSSRRRKRRVMTTRSSPRPSPASFTKGSNDGSSAAVRITRRSRPRRRRRNRPRQR